MGWALCQAWSEVGRSPGFLTEVMRMDRRGCRASLAAPAKIPSLSLSLFFSGWFFHSYSHTKTPSGFFPPWQKLEPSHVSSREPTDVGEKLGWSSWILKKLLLGQELTPQAWIDSFSGDREKMWPSRDVADGDVTSPIFSKLQPPRQLHRLVRTWVEAWSSLVFSCFRGGQLSARNPKPQTRINLRGFLLTHNS